MLVLLEEKQAHCQVTKNILVTLAFSIMPLLLLPPF